MLTGIPLVTALMFVSLFAAFRRPDIGLILAAILLLPIVVFAWIEYGLLVLRVAWYSREQATRTEAANNPGANLGFCPWCLFDYQAVKAAQPGANEFVRARVLVLELDFSRGLRPLVGLAGSRH